MTTSTDTCPADEAGVVGGGDGYASHADCDPDDAVADLSGPDGRDCWICGEELPGAGEPTARP